MSVERGHIDDWKRGKGVNHKDGESRPAPKTVEKFQALRQFGLASPVPDTISPTWLPRNNED